MASATLDESSSTMAQEMLEALRRGSRRPESFADDLSLSELLGEPQELDLWPGHVYIPPKIVQLEKILPLAAEMSELYATDLMASVQRAVEIVCIVARRVEEDDLRPVTPEEVKAAFDPEELAGIIRHILTKQGLQREKKGGLSGVATGVRSFVKSAATTAPTTSSEPES